ncbi:PDZ domain-containing protein [uncultured Polaribacter sp.]|uniref:PDZ domain-containing protein n=1 Tax=uncultured Polaribacter sp. TaxID=174711 RepID=UPI00260CD302|nr:PDZ domain-containing protein [uncultured Polaribacter sp.]
MINNLIVIPLEINGKKLSFILDSGVNKTIIFDLAQNDSIALLNTEKIELRGLGTGEAVDAILSTKNILKLKGIVSYNEAVYVILKDYFDLSSKMGVTIHGIIGYNLLRDFVVKINYKSKKLTFYSSKDYQLKKCRKCEILRLQMHRKKPYINVDVQLDTIGTKLTKVKMLIDSGGSDALWLFEHSKPNIKTPILFFKDILGEGLSGTIYGNRSRIPKLKVGNFTLLKPTISFLDTVTSKNARSFKARNGSIGGNILKRFKIWLDYRNQKIMLKKNGSFTKGFNYNMSGLEVVYNGKQLVKERKYQAASNGYGTEGKGKNDRISLITRYTFNFKSSYKVKTVLRGSPGHKAGVQPGDIILKINGTNTYDLKLTEIVGKFQQRNNKKIKLLIDRNGAYEKVSFRLEKRI